MGLGDEILRGLSQSSLLLLTQFPLVVNSCSQKKKKMILLWITEAVTLGTSVELILTRISMHQQIGVG